MSNNLRDELHALMFAHTTKKAEEARIAKQTQERIDAEELAEVLKNAADREVPCIIDAMRKIAVGGGNTYAYSLGRIDRESHTDERASVIEAALRAEGVTKIVRKRVQKRAAYLDDIDTHMVMEIGW